MEGGRNQSDPQRITYTMRNPDGSTVFVIAEIARDGIVKLVEQESGEVRWYPRTPTVEDLERIMAFLAPQENNNDDGDAGVQLAT